MILVKAFFPMATGRNKTVNHAIAIMDDHPDLYWQLIIATV